MHDCQAQLHQWGRANSVEFDAGKESMHVMSRRSPMGNGFQLLGVQFDEKLLMAHEVESVAASVRWIAKAF